ncbi:MAG: CHC2 zinc finger domain-containing protein [Spirochaetes bacterium]|nr:CHC2 zinc finger domain-containing protein [Spirochaetota bacterium]
MSKTPKPRPVLAGSTLKVDLFREIEKDAVKRQVDIVSLFKYFGVKLKKVGSSYQGLCPWHDDTNPSLSVSPGGQNSFFKCFGCGKSGDVFTLVELMRGYDFKGAMDFLSKWSNNEPAGEVKGKPKKVKDEPLKIVIDDPDKENVGAVEVLDKAPEITLTQIAEYYQKCLNEKALSYLKSRGFTDLELIRRFKIGFSDGSLIEKLSDNQQESLAKTGLLKKSKENGYFEAFGDHIVFPITDETGQVVELYGRSIAGKSKYPHLYQTGGHKGIFNYKAAKVYDEIILTESIIDALSLIQPGLANTTACFGTNGFTEHHLKALKEGNVKRVIIAFDNDEAGQKASEKLKNELLPEGFEVKIISPISFKDWNESLVAGISKSEIEKLISEAQSHKQAEEKKDFIHKRENKLDIFILGGITYKLAGVKEIFVINLKVNITAEIPGDFFVDSVDLCSYRSRMVFSNNLSERFAVEPKRIENHLLKILKFLEEQRQKILNPDEETADLTEEEKETGLAFLKSPDLFDLIVEDMTTLGYVGEDLNKQLIYLCATSRLMDDPISVLIVSESASGKSYLTDTVKKLIPPDQVISITSLSDQALNYLDDLEHKFLVFGEAIHNDIIEHQIREMLSSKELTRLVTMKDEKTGNMVSKMIKKKVISSNVMSTTNYRINPENASRYFLVSADESEEQTRRIHQAQRSKYSLESHYKKLDKIPGIIAKHHAAQRLLKPVMITNPFAPLLDFPVTLMRLRRDHDRFIDLIASVCFLRQYQKEIKTDGNISYIECDLEDYTIAYQIMIHGVLSSTLADLPASANELYEALRELSREAGEEKEVKTNEVTFTQRDIREKTGFGHTWVKTHLKLLVDYEYVELVRGGSGRTRGFYRIKEDEGISQMNLSMIPAPKEMKEKL